MREVNRRMRANIYRVSLGDEMLSCFSRVKLFVTLWNRDRQALLSMGFSKHEYWSGLSFPSLEALLSSGIKLAPPRLLPWRVDSFNTESAERSMYIYTTVLGISELKWTGMGEFNSDDHYIYYCSQESLRRNVVAIMVNKRVQNAVL